MFQKLIACLLLTFGQSNWYQIQTQTIFVCYSIIAYAHICIFLHHRVSGSIFGTIVQEFSEIFLFDNDTWNMKSYVFQQAETMGVLPTNPLLVYLLTNPLSNFFPQHTTYCKIITTYIRRCFAKLHWRMLHTVVCVISSKCLFVQA